MADPGTNPAPVGVLENVDASFVKTLWRLTFNVGGAHHSMVVRDEGTVEWIAEGIRMAGARGLPLPDIAGVALHRVVREHPFIDCNHRTGWLLCRTLMHVGGYELGLFGDDVVNFVKSIDAEGLNENRVREWVRLAFYRSG